MKRQILLLGLGIGIALTSITTKIVLANEEGQHAKHEEASQKEGVPSPETIEGILKEIHEQHTKLSGMVNNKQLAQIHYHAFAIRDLAQKLPAKASAASRVRVGGAVKNIAKLAEDLDESGDAGNQVMTEANLRKLDGVLKVLAAQFPHHHD